MTQYDTAVPLRDLDDVFTVLESAPLTTIGVAVALGKVKVVLWVQTVTMEPEAVPIPVPVTRLIPVPVVRAIEVTVLFVVTRVEVDFTVGRVEKTVVVSPVVEMASVAADVEASGYTVASTVSVTVTGGAQLAESDGWPVARPVLSGTVTVKSTTLVAVTVEVE